MKKPAVKSCDVCGNTVAVKRFLRYHTISDFVTIRADEVPKYSDDVSSTNRVDEHYCRSCWSRIVKVATEPVCDGGEESRIQKILRDMDTSLKRALGYEED